MGETTNIEWCDHTFNPWVGCTKIAPGCANCYAEADMDKRRHFVEWGAGQPRRRTSAANWKQPLKWDRAARAAGVRRRVFCASMADVFDEEVPDAWRDDLMGVIGATPSLDWLLLTKRPANAKRYLEAFRARRWTKGALAAPGTEGVAIGAVLHKWPLRNLGLGVSIATQPDADANIPIVMECPAALRFVSAEPLIEAVDIGRFVRYRDSVTAPDWVIVGGESGHHARPCDVEWIREIVGQCKAAQVACYVKQLGANVRDRNDVGFDADSFRYVDTPANGDLAGKPVHEHAWPDDVADRLEDNPDGVLEEYQGAPVRVHLRDSRGADPTEWPEDLRVREFPRMTTNKERSCT